MKECKLILVKRDYDRNDDLIVLIKRSVSDWEELSDNDYTKLKNNLYHVEQSLRDNGDIGYDDSVIIVTKGLVSVGDALIKIKDLLDEQTKKIEAEAKKKEAAKKKADAGAVARKAEKDRKLLARLKAEYESDKA